MGDKGTECLNVATGEVIGYSPLHTVDDLHAAIKKARVAQKIWASLSISERVRKVRAIRDHIVDNLDRFAEVISRDNGKTRTDSLITELVPSTMAVSYYMKHAKAFLKDEKLPSGHIALLNKRSKIIRVPYGVIAIFSPWNYPFSIPFSEVIMGLLAGNAVLLKTASETQMVGLLLKECVDAAKLPEGLFTFINMSGSIAGDAFLEAGIDKLFFTGSVPVGKKLMAKAAETLTPICLELGGNDPMIVCADADLERAAGGASWGGFQNSGQTCGGVERIYVEESVYEPFLQLLKKKVEALRVGYDTDFNVDVGAMTTERQIKLVKSHIEDALAKGAKIYAQSKVPSDPKLKNFLPSMILTDVTHDMLVMKEETFGPVVGVMKFRTEAEAIALSNDSNLGLTGSVWSRDAKKAERIARQIQVGVMNINDHVMSHGMAETSWGGFKESGIGWTHGKMGFDEMSHAEVIVWDVLPGVKKDIWWHPFSETLYNGLKGMVETFYGRCPKRRFLGFLKFMRIAPRMFFR